MPIKSVWATALLVSASMAAVAAVPKATCRNPKTDRPETGLQGATPKAERDSGASQTAYKCNTNLVGQFQGEGASWQFAAWKNCAYYATANNSSVQNRGTVVVDVSDPAFPTFSGNLTEPAMLDPWESLKVNPTRQLLAAAQANGPGFSVYDISGDCRHPALKASVNLTGSFGHTGDWAPDGNTYYITPLRASPSFVAVDVADASNPKAITFWTAPSGTNPVIHDIEISKDGTRAYLAQFSLGSLGSTCYGTVCPGVDNGLLILDTSEIQARTSNPQVHVISQLHWNDGSGGQKPLRVSIAGKPYLIFSDELGSAGVGVNAFSTACAANLPLSGFARIIDISQEASPKIVSKLMLELHDVANCQTIIADGYDLPNNFTTLAYSSHYCNVDDVNNATILACTYWAAGLRIFDIRDPANPKEIGYYKPPARGTQVLPGSQRYVAAGAGFNRTTDWSSAKPSFPQDRGMTSGDIWMTSEDNGFMVVHLDHSGGGGCGIMGGVDASAVVGLLTLLRCRRRRTSKP
jgi:hypothetical protein